MTIQQILQMPVGQRFGGGDYTVKTCKKKWTDSGRWVQQVVLSDESGDMLVDVNIEKNIGLQRCSILHVVVGLVQHGVAEVSSDNKKRIYIEQFTQPSIPEPTLSMSMDERIARSKVRCWLVAACLQHDPKADIDETKLDRHVNYIMK